MVTQIKEFNSAQAIAEALDQQLSETKSILGENLRKLDEIRTVAEKSKKVREVVMKLAGKKTSNDNPSEITIGSLNIILDANAFHELTAIEAVVRSHQERLLTLQKAHDALKWLDQLGDTEGLKYLVLENDGIPERILFKDILGIEEEPKTVTEPYTNTLQTIIGEFKNLDPDITNAIVFRSNGEIIAATEDTTTEQTQTIISSLKGITHAECIGRIEKLKIQGPNSQLNLTTVNDTYLVTVSSRVANQKIIKSLTQVIAPAIIRSTLQAVPVIIEKPIKPEEPSMKQVASVESVEQEPKIESILETQSQPEAILPKAPTTQFMVENIGGLLVAPDTVRIESEVIAKWKELYGDKQFTTVSIETLAGKTVTCKFKSQKDTKSSAKGTIGIPDKILQALESNKGKLVMVKPVIQ